MSEQDSVEIEVSGELKRRLEAGARKEGISIDEYLERIIKAAEECEDGCFH
jgi:predicted HicB family RNase H-like nuclease